MGDVDPYVTDRYEVLKRLGKGAYGIVWKAIDKENKKIVAVKKIYDAFRNRTDAQRTFREIWYLQEFHNHSNIITLLKVVKAKNDKDIYLIFDFMETDLHQMIKKGVMKEEWKHGFIIFQLLSALAYIHSANVIHRDIKPSNILMNNRCELKLADFGLARSLEQEGEYATDPTLTEYVATRWYRAPEILLGSKCYTKGVDLWSVGCIMGEVISGKPLFPGTSTLNQVERIMAALPHPMQADIDSLCTGYAAFVLGRAANKPKRLLRTVLLNCSNDAHDLLSKLLALNPNHRMTAKDGLQHAYVARYHGQDPPSELSKSVPPLCDGTKLSVDQYRDKLYEMIAENPEKKSVSPMPPIQMPSYADKRNERRIFVKHRTFDEIPTIDERKEALLRSQIAKKQPMAPVARKTLTPPFLSERGKFSLGFRHPVILRGQDSSTTLSADKKPERKLGKKQFGNMANHSMCSSAKAALQSYSQDLSYGTITVTALKSLREKKW
ncbi:mitogen-activated protein kinase 15-like [Uloborus diversus]|uniref:mitogen-activated protein kinase 15-like n=1 Tax=Uloborus diversus TaxID=327109 RepID=UPI0024097471|nr:mitogen-activated protein kinase 15-like [Uloborus diversus]